MCYHGYMTIKNVKLTMTGNTRGRIKELAKQFGYGHKQTNKFINKVLDLAENMSFAVKK